MASTCLYLQSHALLMRSEVEAGAAAVTAPAQTRARMAEPCGRWFAKLQPSGSKISTNCLEATAHSYQ